MKRVFLPIILLIGLAFSPFIFADVTKPPSDCQNQLVGVSLKTADGQNIQVFVSKNDVDKVKQLKEGEKVELYGYGINF
ncbi:hypothetical protein [Legionella tunisiensis]|uniref:hypothetical protein n=1 Tax=Legionella tunisiensis TaxID=1034944 RepID=UPI000310038C|nr:hypothetical protein [Legionella tunisiensis]